MKFFSFCILYRLLHVIQTAIERVNIVMKHLILRSRAIALIAAALVILQACSPLSAVNAVAPSKGITLIPDLAYGTGDRQMLDLYRPDGAQADLPTILFFYGGSWKRGSREKYAFAARALAREGYLVAVADYRTYPDVKFPAFVHDGAKAVAWLTQNAKKYGGKSNRIHMMGHSAGAHIAAMIALDEKYLARENISRDVLGRWVGLAGPYAFYPSQVRSVRDIFSDLSDEAQARPVTFAATLGAPSALLLHGGDDTLVLPENSKQLASALSAAGVNAHAHIYPDIGHVRLVLSLSAPFQGFASTLKDSVKFLKTGAVPRNL